jgi:hypothetical protein
MYKATFLILTMLSLPLFAQEEVPEQELQLMNAQELLSSAVRSCGGSCAKGQVSYCTTDDSCHTHCQCIPIFLVREKAEE